MYCATEEIILNDLMSFLGLKLGSNSLASHCGKVTQQSAGPTMNFTWKKSYQVVHLKLACFVRVSWQVLDIPVNSYVLLIRKWCKIYSSVQAALQPLLHDMPLQLSILPAQLVGEERITKESVIFRSLSRTRACVQNRAKRNWGRKSHLPCAPPVPLPSGQ